MKQGGLIKQLDQWLITSYVDDPDRRHDVNSPSQATTCLRALYYARIGEKKDVLDPRARRIFDNGSWMHYRIQKYLEQMGVLLIKEAPIFNLEYNIQGHTDGILKYFPSELAVLELKSINSRGFSELKQVKPEHVIQGSVYLFCLEEHRKTLKKYKTPRQFKLSQKKREKMYTKLYNHLKDDPWEGGKTREEKVIKKVSEHLALDDLLYNTNKPITKVVFLYENKDTQELKEFVVKMDKELLQQTLDRFILNNKYSETKECPPRECKIKNKFCSYSSICFK